MPQIYRVSKSNKIAINILMGLLLPSGIFIFVYPFLATPPKPPNMLLFLTCLGLGTALGSLYGLLWSFRFQVEIESGLLRIRGVFGEKEIPLGDIKEFAIVPGRSITLYGDDSKKILSFIQGLENEKEFLQWARHHFKDRSTETASREHESAMADENLGADETERKATLARAKQLTKVLGFVAFGVGFWSILYPRPYYLVVGILIFLPLVAVLAVLFSRGAIRFNVRKNGTYASADAAFLAVWFLALRALMDWDILDWTHFWLPFTAIALALFALLMICSKSSRSKVGTILPTLFYFAIYSAGTTLALNGMLDTSQPTTYESHVAGKRISQGKHTSYYLTLPPWGPVQETKEYKVSRDSYQQHQTGDRVTVDLREGALHIPYCYIY